MWVLPHYFMHFCIIPAIFFYFVVFFSFPFWLFHIACDNVSNYPKFRQTSSKVPHNLHFQWTLHIHILKLRAMRVHFLFDFFLPFFSFYFLHFFSSFFFWRYIYYKFIRTEYSYWKNDLADLGSSLNHIDSRNSSSNMHLWLVKLRVVSKRQSLIHSRESMDCYFVIRFQLSNFLGVHWPLFMTL